MKKIMMTLTFGRASSRSTRQTSLFGARLIAAFAAVLCCMVTTVVSAQNTPEQALKQAEQKAKLADKNLKNGKMQLEAAYAFINEELGEKKDLDRALTYANRGYKISQEHPAPQDTLKGLSCYALGIIYMQKQSYENFFDFVEMAMDGFQEELGRYDPVTIGTKLAYSAFMMGPQPLRAYSKIQDAFNDNENAPRDKRIEKMEEANILLEMALEMLIAEQTRRFRYALPLIFKDGKRFFVVQTKFWNMERPLVGWQVQNELATDEERENAKDDLILCDDQFQFFSVPKEEKDKYEFIFHFNHRVWNPRKLEGQEGDSRIFFLNPDSYNKMLEGFRALKTNNK